MGLRARAGAGGECTGSVGYTGPAGCAAAGPYGRPQGTPKAPLDKELAEEYVSCILSAYSPSALLPLGSYSPSALTPPRLLLPLGSYSPLRPFTDHILDLLNGVIRLPRAKKGCAQ
jgi:hypothetical protein